METMRISRSRRRCIVGIFKTIVVVLLLDGSRYFVSLIPPVTAREMLIRISDLPMPLVVWDGKALDQCLGFICMDYRARASGRLGREGCERALGAAVMQGFLPLPFREEPGNPRPKVDDWPEKGYYLFFSDADSQRIVWIDSESCRVFASVASW
jgi:hypothetical protein